MNILAKPRAGKAGTFPEHPGQHMARHSKCRSGVYCDGPGCIIRTGKTNEKRHRDHGHKTGHDKCGGRHSSHCPHINEKQFKG